MINICLEDRGLGTAISILSTLAGIANTGEQVNIYTTPKTKLEMLVDIYKLSDKINITHINIPRDTLQFEMTNSMTECGKSFAPYIKHPNRNVAARKKYIGVGFYNNAGWSSPHATVKKNMDNGNTAWPFYRYHDTDVFAYICKLAKELDYDVISLDSYDLNLTEKIDFLNNHCAAVISYEGGMAHLAHTLDIPCVILPPRANIGFPYTQVHLDTQTYFLYDIPELFSWNVEMLEKVIDDLKHHKGNNVFLDENTDITVKKAKDLADGLIIKSSIGSLNTYPNGSFAKFSKLENEWIDKYFINKTESTESVLIGGIRKVPLSPMVYNEFFRSHYNAGRVNAAPDPIIPTIIPTPLVYNKYNPAPNSDIPTIIPASTGYNKYK